MHIKLPRKAPCIRNEKDDVVSVKNISLIFILGPTYQNPKFLAQSFLPYLLLSYSKDTHIRLFVHQRWMQANSTNSSFTTSSFDKASGNNQI